MAAATPWTMETSGDYWNTRRERIAYLFNSYAESRQHEDVGAATDPDWQSNPEVIGPSLADARVSDVAWQALFEAARTVVDGQP